MLTLKLPRDLISRRDIRSSGKLLYGLMLAEGRAVTVEEAAAALGYSQRGTKAALDSLEAAGLVERTKDQRTDLPRKWHYRYVYRAKEHSE